MQALNEHSRVVEGNGVTDSKRDRVAAPLVAYKGILISLLVCVSVGAFANSIWGQLVYDDAPQIAGNPLFGHWDAATLKRILTSDLWSPINSQPGGGGPDSLYYRPIYSLFLMFGSVFAGRSPAWWHMVSILLHTTVVLLVFHVMEKSLAAVSPLNRTPRTFAAGLGAAIFAVHPVQSESVSWISGSPNLLLSIFMLTSFSLYFRLADNYEGVGRRLGFQLLSPFFFGLALLTKESGAALLLIIIAYELLVFRPADLKWRLRAAALRVAPFLAVFAGYVGVRYAVLGSVFGRNLNANYPEQASVTIGSNLMTIPSLLAHYLRLLFVPSGYSMIYDFDHIRRATLETFWAPLSIVAVMLAVSAYSARRVAEARLALIWIVPSLLLHMNTRAFVSDDLIHDRYLYLPMIGVGLIVALPFVRFGAGKWRPRLQPAAALAVALVVVLAVLAALENRKWRDEETLWSHTVTRAPNSRIAHIAMGLLAEKRQDLEGALKEYEGVLRIHPDTVDGLNNAAFVLAKQGRWHDATRNFERIVTLTPNNPISHFNLSVAYGAQRNFADEARELERAITLEPAGPQSGEWRSRLSMLQRKLGTLPAGSG